MTGDQLAQIRRRFDEELVENVGDSEPEPIPTDRQDEMETERNMIDLRSVTISALTIPTKTRNSLPLIRMDYYPQGSLIRLFQISAKLRESGDSRGYTAGKTD